MEARDVLDVLDVLTEDGHEAILDGGWGIEALLGAQHRDHDDLDLLVRLDQLDGVLATLGAVGFAIDGDDRPTRVSLADRSGRAIDLHLVRLEGGERWQAAGAPGGGDLAYRTGDLTTGWVGGRPVPCIGALLQVAHHTGYPPRPRDRHDLELLQQRFGVSLPEGYR